ncbi:unnamed protein product [Didymodactylos carnosus]|uniref:Phosphoglucomutase n=1 Tax=Didymodactylos carnosus TaxID=1234261 RepID=A0A8S2D6U2_9BILA|nr:unnamed protein product [Didymodactylos carnosus]CAF3609569.1 unnamed protein product [Didymodactylos carnosus]
MSPADIKVAFGQPLEFGTAGIRGKMGIVGHDNRANSDQFSIEVANMLTTHGIMVKMFINNELMPTPIISYAVRKLKLQAAINITASHNPKADNGFKAYDETGAQLLPKDTDDIAKRMSKIKDAIGLVMAPAVKLVTYVPQSVMNSYLSEVTENLRIKKNLELMKTKVVYTPHHGTGATTMLRLLESLNYQVIPVKEQMTPDPNFSFSPSSNPEDAASYDLAIKYAEKNRCQLIMATDPDADRLGIAVKHNGN